MSPTETKEILSEDIVETSEADSVKLVPVTESIRYRKRAQNAEKKIESLTEQLSQTQEQSAKLAQQLGDIQAEQALMHKLISAGAVDIESAVLLVKSRMQNQTQADPDNVIERLKKEKQYLFTHHDEVVTTVKTAGPKERSTNVQTVLERAAKKAATTGNRTDLHEYLKLRRKYL
jgi:uncharacterized protein YhaN